MSRRKFNRRQFRRRARRNNVHHVIPQSRCNEFRIDPDDVRNKIMVNKREHELYHALFENKTPYEALEYLLNTFWIGFTFPEARLKGA